MRLSVLARGHPCPPLTSLSQERRWWLCAAGGALDLAIGVLVIAGEYSTA
jgi:hypothetical protein